MDKGGLANKGGLLKVLISGVLLPKGDFFSSLPIAITTIKMLGSGMSKMRLIHAHLCGQRVTLLLFEQKFGKITPTT